MRRRLIIWAVFLVFCSCLPTQGGVVLVRTLYLVTIGINQYSERPLKFAINDAIAFGGTAT